MRRTQASGFSLIELMVTVGIVAILVAVAFPSFEGSLRRNRLATSTNELIASVSLARSEAVRNTRGGGICASTDGVNCGADWNAGWLVWTDGDAAPPFGTFNPAVDTVVRVTNAHPRMVLAVTDNNNAAVTSIGFDHRGRPLAALAAPLHMNIRPDECPDGMDFVRDLQINLVGQTTNHKDACP